MILVVIVAFTLFSSALFVAKFNDRSYETEIKELKNRIEALHKENGKDKSTKK